METIVKNEYNLSEEEITNIVKRVKILIINTNNEVLLAYSHNNYQFPGGHVEDGESYIETVNREIKEETGIIFRLDDSVKPFLSRFDYYKDYPSVGKNTKSEIYYYEIKTDEKYNLNNTNYTEHELDGNFSLKYISLDEVENELNNNTNKYGDNRGISGQMIELFKIYKNRV